MATTHPDQVQLRFLHPGQDQLVEDFRQRLQKVGVPLRIVSGYRSPERNAAVGGAKNSFHTKGTAADIDLSGMSDLEKEQLYYNVWKQGGIPRIGTYDSGNSLHVDMGDSDRWGSFWPMHNRSQANMENAPDWAKNAVNRIRAEMGQGGIDPRMAGGEGGPAVSPYHPALADKFAEPASNAGTPCLNPNDPYCHEGVIGHPGNGPLGLPPAGGQYPGSMGAGLPMQVRQKPDLGDILMGWAGAGSADPRANPRRRQFENLMATGQAFPSPYVQGGPGGAGKIDYGTTEIKRGKNIETWLTIDGVPVRQIPGASAPRWESPEPKDTTATNSDINSIRGQYLQEFGKTGWAEVGGRYGSIVENLQQGDNPFANVATLINFLKVFDPTSVVSQGEYDLVSGARGPLAPWADKLNQAITGKGTIDREMAEQIAEALYPAVMERYEAAKQVNDNYIYNANAMGVDPRRVVGAPLQPPPEPFRLREGSGTSTVENPVSHTIKMPAMPSREEIEEKIDDLKERIGVSDRESTRFELDLDSGMVIDTKTGKSYPPHVFETMGDEEFD